MDIDQENLKKLRFIKQKRGKAICLLYEVLSSDVPHYDFLKRDLNYLLPNKLVEFSDYADFSVVLSEERFKYLANEIQLYAELYPKKDDFLIPDSSLTKNYRIPIKKAYCSVSATRLGTAVVEKWKTSFFDTVFARSIVFIGATAAGAMAIYNFGKLIWTWISGLISPQVPTP